MLRRVLPEPGPVRVLMVSTLVNAAGGGLFFTGSMLFFTRVIGLPATQVGAGLTAAGLVGLAAGVPLGHLGDRLGRREVYIVLLLLQAVTAAAYVAVGTFPAFLLVASANLVAQSGSFAVRNALVASLGGPAERVPIRARLRAVLHVGFAAGAGLGAVALQVDTPAAYTTLILCDAASFALTALLLTRMPRQVPLPPVADAARWEAVRDRGYLAITAVSSVMALHYGIWLLDAAVGDRAYGCPALARVRAARDRHVHHHRVPGTREPGHRAGAPGGRGHAPRRADLARRLRAARRRRGAAG
ncbi:MAG: MFS transporter [Carbonactinosporaceae bacterium]